ncbi:MAG: trigger factor [Clostridia bacterium]|nr:trigger factor [Clostridia bacterium]MBQ8512737.1 trigger factor [Clostridia bacterium]
MKKAVSLILAALALSASLVSCGADDDLLTHKYNYDLSEYITLADYKNIPAQGYRFELTEEEVQQQIYATRSYYSRTTDVTDRPAQMGDIVYIDYVGTIGGEEFEGGSETDCEVTIGMGTFMEGFEESLIGKNPGDSYSIDLTFPDPYPSYPENSGKDVHFEITVDSIMEQELPLYNEDFVRAYLGFDSIEAFETHVRELLADHYQDIFIEYIDSQTWNQLIENTTVIKYPEAEVTDMYDSIVASNKAYAQAMGLNFSAYVEVNYDVTEEEYLRLLREQCEARIKEEMICYAIAREEKITLSEEEYQERALEYAVDTYNVASVAAFENIYAKETIRQTIMFDLVHELVAAEAAVTYPAE